MRLLRLLEREGAIPDDVARQYVACLGVVARVPDVVSAFAPDGVNGCDEQAVAHSLEGRSE